MKTTTLLRMTAMSLLATGLLGCGGGSSSTVSNEVKIDLKNVSWAAYDDESGWKKIDTSDVNFTFEPTGDKYGVAIKCKFDPKRLKITQATPKEINYVPSGCKGISMLPITYHASGSVSNIPYNNLVINVTGDNSNNVINNPADPYQYNNLGNVPTGDKGDVVATSFKINGTSIVNAKMAIKRGRAFNGQNQIINVDMATDGFDLHKHQFKVKGDHVNMANMFFISKNITSTIIGRKDDGVWFKAPKEKIEDGEYYIVWAADYINSKENKSLWYQMDGKTDMEDFKFDLKSINGAKGSFTASNATFDNLNYTPSPSSPPLRMYDLRVSETNGATTDSIWKIRISKDWLGSGNSYTLPDLSSLDGMTNKFNIDNISSLDWNIGDSMISIGLGEFVNSGIEKEDLYNGEFKLIIANKRK